MPQLRFVVCASILLLSLLSAHAQNAPAPPSPYPAPVVGYLGRFVDSTSTIDRPDRYIVRMLRAAPERDALYAVMGYTRFVRYRLSTFGDRVASEPLETFPGSRPNYGERFLRPDKLVDAGAVGSTWPPNSKPGHLTLHGFDWDDRGLNYLAFSSYWGVIDDATFSAVSVTVDSSFAPMGIFAFRDGGTYYALVTGWGESRLYDVTNPLAPRLVRKTTSFYGSSAKSRDGRIAVIHGGTIEIHTPATLAADGQPLFATNGAAYIDVVTDGLSFYGLSRERESGGVDVIVPSNNGYVATRYASAELANTLAYGLGYLTAPAASPFEPGQYYVYGASPNGLALLNRTYFYWDYYLASRLYVALPVMSGTRRLLLVANGVLGDVYVLGTAKRRSALH